MWLTALLKHLAGFGERSLGKGMGKTGKGRIGREGIGGE